MPTRHHRAAAGRFTTVRHAALFLLTGLTLAMPVAVFAQAQDAPAERASPADPYAGYIAEAARRFGVPEAWIRAVMRVESRGNVHAISSAGAMP